jgi:hypothetical protein
MPYGHTDHDHGGTATMTPEKVAAKVTNPCGPPPIATSTCCDLICFERPRYFCGHLLKDTDLTTEQRYVVEKHKLYHRTLHGQGIVCGLRLTCDSTCCGDVRIGDGYAIDDCGNDIVVCESARFDVMARLKEKGLLIPTAPADPCDEEKEVSPCVVRQCFYIVVCYQETEHDFTTPLTPGCGPSPKDCEATRVRESYVFDVVDRRPPVSNPLDDLRKRMEKCFALFSDPPFASALAEVRRLICQRDTTASVPDYEAANYDTLEDLYCKLRGLLLLYLKKHPDQYNCRIESDILGIKIPSLDNVRKGMSLEAIFCRLIEIAYNHVISCLLGELAFPCPAPARASCVVLGTVEVEDGCVVRVCNCPRDYVWTFPSFFQVLINTLFASAACETVEAPEHRDAATHGDCGCKKADPTQTCCRTYTIEDCCRFIERMVSVGKSAAKVSGAAVESVDAVKSSLAYVFDPTRWDTLPASAFVGRTLKELSTDPFMKDVSYEVRTAAAAFPPLDPIQAFAQSFLTTRADRFMLETDPDGRVVAAQPVPEIYTRVAQLESELAAMKDALGGFTPGERGGPEPKSGRGRKTKG